MFVSTGMFPHEFQESVQNSLEIISADRTQYKVIPASQTDYILENAIGAIGDEIASLVIVPGNTTPGTVVLKDGSAGVATTIFAGTGQNVVTIPLGMKSFNGGWRVTTGTNVTVWALGAFS